MSITSYRKRRVLKQAALDTSLSIDTRTPGPATSGLATDIFVFESPTRILKLISKAENLTNDMLALKKAPKPSPERTDLMVKLINTRDLINSIIEIKLLKEAFALRLPEKVELLVETCIKTGFRSNLYARNRTLYPASAKQPCYGEEAERLAEKLINDVQKAARSPKFRSLTKKRSDNARYCARIAVGLGKAQLEKAGILEVIEVIFSCKQDPRDQGAIDQQVDGLCRLRSRLIKSIRKHPLLRPLKAYLWRLESQWGRPALRIIFFARSEAYLPEKVLHFAQGHLHESASLYLATTNLLSSKLQSRLYPNGYPYGIVNSIDIFQVRRLFDALHAFGHMSSELRLMTNRTTKMFYQGVLNEH